MLCGCECVLACACVMCVCMCMCHVHVHVHVSCACACYYACFAAPALRTRYTCSSEVLNNYFSRFSQLYIG